MLTSTRAAIGAPCLLLSAGVLLLSGCSRWPPQHDGISTLYVARPWMGQVTRGQDGSIWFITTVAGSLDNTIGRVNSAGTVTEFAPPNAVPLLIRSIAVDSAGAVWFTASRKDDKTNAIYRMSPGGGYTAYHLAARAVPYALAIAPDGDVWFTETAADKIGRLTKRGTLREYDIPHERGVHPGPFRMAFDTRGDIWFTLTFSNAVGRMTESGRFTEFPIPTPKSRPLGIAAGPDGEMWFTESLADKIGRITAQGKIEEFADASINDNPHDIAAGHDGDLWFCESGWIGRITIQGRVAVQPDAAGGTCVSVLADANGEVWSSLDLGPGPWRFSGPPYGVVARFSARDWIAASR